MALFRMTGMTNEVIDRRIFPGDLVAGGENILAGSITTVGAGVLTAAAIATGIIRRTGPVGGFTDTTDTAANIINALLCGSGQISPDCVPGTSFRLLYINTVAQAMTFAAGTGVVAGTGTLNVAASNVREYLVTVLNTSPVQIYQCATSNSGTTYTGPGAPLNSTLTVSQVVTFNLPINAVSLPELGSNGLTGTTLITPGMSVSGTGISAGTTVIGVIQGVGGITGVTLSAAATATNTSVALTFGPTVQFDGLFSATL